MPRKAKLSTAATDADLPEGTVVHIRALLPSLPPAGRQLGEYIVANPTAVTAMTITEISTACGVSETSTVRFCRAIGFHGYAELRLALAAEMGRVQGSGHVGRVVGSDITPADDLSAVIEKISYADARAVEETAAQLDVDVLKRVIDALVAARRVDVYGVGASAFVALDFQQKLHRIGRVAFAWSDIHIALTSAALLGKQDVAVGISHTGVTRDTIEALTEAGHRGATTVALTNFPLSPIAKVADLVLTTAARETTFRSGATASRLAQLTVVDCMFVGVAQRTYADTRTALEKTREAISGHRVASRGSKR
ncbi:MAG TPA: MurR/RpiR family transcriptional regulator [Jatrophihabitantaceae bacterium]